MNAMFDAFAAWASRALQQNPKLTLDELADTFCLSVVAESAGVDPWLCAVYFWDTANINEPVPAVPWSREAWGELAQGLTSCSVRDGELIETMNRKLLGAYYTPKFLVDLIVRGIPECSGTVELMFQQRVRCLPISEQREALLSLTVCDPACGVGACLFGALDMFVEELKRIQGHACPADVVHCLYGVDIDERAIKMLRAAMALECDMDPNVAMRIHMNFQCGNALMGAWFSDIEQGIPSEAWTALDGDDKRIARELRAMNKIRPGPIS